MSKAVACPVCGGSGKYYTNALDKSSEGTCHGCGGTGWVEVAEDRLSPNTYPVVWNGDKIEVQTVSDCMHDNCPGCKAGTCNGIHMMSCPCKKCTPIV